MAMRQCDRPRPSPRATAVVEIQNGASVSDLINLTGHVLSAIQCSSSWTTAVIGFKSASLEGSTAVMYDVKNSNGDFLTFQTSASQVLVFDPSQLAGLQKIQLVSCTTAGVATNQGGLRSLVLSLTPFSII